MLSRSWKFFIVFSFVLFSFAKATHNRAGEITYKRIEPFTKVIGGVTVQVYTYSITIIKYTDDGPGIADRCVDTIYFGDGDRGIAPRIKEGMTGCGCGSFNGQAVGCGTLIINESSGSGNGYKVKMNVYTIIHTYPGAGSYLIRTLDPNRNQGVHNIPNSVNLPFYIESKLIINSFTGANSSPVFTFPPVDRACKGVCFEHNPGAYDPDGDSLSYEITTSRGEDGQTVLGYFFPETGAGGSYGINARTGLLRWCTPQLIDEYNIAFIVKEWRKNTSGTYQLIGYVLRDMQVIVKECLTNLPPSIQVPQDICVEAGKTVTANLTVSDPNNGDVITVEGGGGPFSGPAPFATYNPSSGSTTNANGNKFNVFFSWQTICDHIRSQPYETTFKVQDSGWPGGSTVKLVSFSTFNIKVVPPTVKNVTATPEGTTIKISWFPSTCSPSENPLVSYRIYRKPDCTPYTPDPCTTGLPTSSGFTLIGQTSFTTSSFIDNNNGDGLVVGQDYSYVVVAVYKDGTQTFGSTQVCAKLKRDVPVVLNIDVKSTSTVAGSIWVRWTKPLINSGNFDTLTMPRPYKFILKHRTGSTGNYNDIFTTSNNILTKLDTDFVHTNLNTTLNNEEYVIEFIAGTVTIGSTQRASSIFLKTIPSDRKIDLEWSSKTPWNNYKYTVMRQDSTSPNFVPVATTTLTTYSDVTNVVNGSTYCYYIIGEGAYSDPGVYKPLVNSSQQSCTKAIDETPPAIPTLTIDADCPTDIVTVSWNDIRNIPGSDDVYKYILYYKPTVNDNYTEIATVLSNEPTSFHKDDNKPFSGCYAIKAVDLHGNESALSPDFCIDNCPIFELPNIFSPNNDGANDFFKAIRVRQIKEINLSIVDRWGNPVYFTKDPYFQWNGISSISKVAVSEGTFFYVCDVYESRLKGTVKRTLKGWVQVVR
jgi:gliding motility-associated-like protein